MAEFIRRRDLPGWAERSLELCDRHPQVDQFKRIRALAILELASETGTILIGGKPPVTLEDLNRAADDMKAIAEHCLDIGFADDHDLVAYLNNAAMLLRLSGRHAECEDLLKRGLLKVPQDYALIRLLAMVQASAGCRREALATLATTGDNPESQLLSAELVAIDEPAAALARALEINEATLSAHLGRLR